ncbi:MAG: type II toxin-antitoxin system HipA family toxin, partial [Bacteroidaceae bacterium]|nr:type II toxin-antitoxin system HipA family toxin [Bacteroidaceae bacterium]
ERFGVGYQLSPAYDLLAVWLTGIKDNDELAMPLVGFGTDDDQTIAGFSRASFVEAMYQSGIEEKISSRIIDKMCASTQKWDAIIDSSFLSDELQSAYKKLVRSRIERLLKL